MANVDKGYAWVIAFAVAINNGIFLGIVKSLGILFIAFYDRLNVSRGFAATISVTSLAVTNILGVFTALLLYKVGYKIPILTGAAIATLGIFSSAFVSSGIHLLITFGIVQGIGFGLSLLPNMSITTQFFRKHRAKANGIQFAGATAGSSILPPLLEFFIEKYTLSGALLLLSGISLHAIASSLLLREPPKENTLRKLDENEESLARSDKMSSNDDKSKIDEGNYPEDAIWHAGKDQMQYSNPSYEESIFDQPAEKPDSEAKIPETKDRANQTQSVIELYRSTLKSWMFYLIVMTGPTVIFALVAFHTDHALSVGIEKHSASYLISAAAIADFIGRLIIGYSIDKRWLHLSTSYGISHAIAAIFLIPIAIVPNQSFTLLCICTLTYSVAYGSCVIHLPVVGAHYLSPDRIPIIFSAQTFLVTFSIISIAPISTYSYSTYGNQFAMFTLLIVLYAISAIGWLTFSVMSSVRLRKTKASDESNKRS